MGASKKSGRESSPRTTRKKCSPRCQHAKMIPPTAAIDSPPTSNGREAVKRGVLWELPFSQIFSLLCRRERKEKRPPSGCVQEPGRGRLRPRVFQVHLSGRR